MSTDPDALLTVRDVAERLKVSTRTIQTMTKAGELPTVRIRRAVRFRPADVRAFVDRGDSKKRRRVG
ncbi:MAG TPA: helix-turn-helix domain-containing protein [Pirellulales bacterium]|nr:helix-turn-helix domain-containing protein [Pirellulales bacterium]